VPLTAKQKGWLLLGALAVGIILLDQGTKAWAEYSLKETATRSITLIDGYLDLRYARNPGAAFSMFRGWSPTTRGVFFVGVSLVAVAAMIYLYRRMPERRPLYEWALGMLIGGAVGNLVDRLRFNEVIDFIDMHWKDAHWPTYNVADTAIVVGIGLVLIDAFLQRPTGKGGSGRKS
jgi:signal peptidase II